MFKFERKTLPIQKKLRYTYIQKHLKKIKIKSE